MADTASNDQNSNTGNNSPGGLNSVIRYLTTKPTQTFLLTIRIATLVFTLFYLVPITSFSPPNLYQKALLANAAISALRLHQRLPPFQISREYLSRLLLEDSAHYLLYSLIFMMNQPITMVLLPISLFAFLHASSGLLEIIKVAGFNGAPKMFLENILQNQRKILLMIAFAEITLFPTIILAIMTNLASLFTPFMYYQFLVLRYASRRNPYSQQAFHWLRINIQQYAMSPSCPNFLRNLSLKGIEIVCRFAPPIQQ